MYKRECIIRKLKSKMPFKSGHELSKGRPKGSGNKSSEVFKKTDAVLMENNIKLVQNDLDQMQPRDRVAAILQFMKFVIPTQKAVEIEDNSQDTRSDYIKFGGFFYVKK